MKTTKKKIYDLEVSYHDGSFRERVKHFFRKLTKKKNIKKMV
jgi:hypothetical protein